MELNSEKYVVNGREFYFRWNVRARIQFEKMTGISLDDDQDDVEKEVTEEEAYMMAYCGTVAGMRKEVQPFEMSFDDYLDFVDMDVDPIISLFAKFIPEGSGDKKKAKKKRVI